MESLLQAFGIDVKLIVVQIINFVVLAGLLTYFLYKPVLKLLADREEKIKQGILDAEEAAHAKAQAQEERQVVLSAAQKEAAEIDARAKAHAESTETQIVAQAHEKASNIVKDAEAKSALLKEQALKESEAEIAKLAILAAEKVLNERTT